MAVRRPSQLDMLSHEFLPEDKLVDALKICTTIWESPERNVDIYADLLRENLNNKHFYDELEFYLPQIAHMAIHLGNSNLELAHSLERMVLSICQFSLHSALEFTFILKAALEDYQPEMPNGRANPDADILLYNKCARLIEHIERVVVYTSTPSLMDNLSQNDKIISEIVLSSGPEDDVSGNTLAMEGPLLFKRSDRIAFYRTKGWKPRNFRIQNHSLYCYRGDKFTKPIRSVSLLDCNLVIPSASKHPFYFELHSTVSTACFHLRAADNGIFQKWIDAIKAQMERPPTVVQTAHITEASEENTSQNGAAVSHGGDDAKPSSQMTAAERARFDFFRGEMKFITELTEISESLR